MSNLFKKAAVFGDLHIGAKNNSLIHNTDCANFIDWFVTKAQEEGCETCLFLGDWHHNRAAINIQSLSFSIKSLEKLNDAFEQTYALCGNHDLFYKNDRVIHSIEWAKHLPNIHVIDEWLTAGDVTLIPWLIGEEHKRIQKIKTKYVFGHFEIPHFKMNSLVTMPDHGNVHSEDFDKIEKVFSGHFHMRQVKNNIHYIGNAFPHNFADTGDADRGCMILEWGGEPVYHSWPDQPLYTVTKLSDLIDNAAQILKPNMHLKVEMDIPVSYEEANFIKDTFLRDYNLREMALLPIKNNSVDVDLAQTEVKFESIDSIVEEQLSNITSDFYDSQLLLAIYRSL